MPDVTVSFTDAQWTRIVAASTSIKGPAGDGTDIDADYLIALWKSQMSSAVIRHEHEQASVPDFE